MIYFYFWKKILLLCLSISSICPSLINKVIRLGDDNFTYTHFSFFSNGDMIIDSSSFPFSNERRFFGLRENGNFYFDEEESGYCSINVNHTNGRIEGESYGIKINSTNSDYNEKELILGISKDENHYVEIYNLDDKSVIGKFLNRDIFGDIYSDYFSIEKTPDESGNIYTIAYVVKQEDLFYIKIKKTYFTFDSYIKYTHIQEYTIQTGDQNNLSCFYLQSLNYLCYYLSLDALNLRVRAYPSDLSSEVKSNIYSTTSTYQSSTFFKGIHLKGDIGVFTYFKIDENYPTISFLKCKNDRSLIPYQGFKDIDINKEINFNIDVHLNDIIKMIQKFAFFR